MEDRFFSFYSESCGLCQFSPANVNVNSSVHKNEDNVLAHFPYL